MNSQSTDLDEILDEYMYELHADDDHQTCDSLYLRSPKRGLYVYIYKATPEQKKTYLTQDCNCGVDKNRAEAKKLIEAWNKKQVLDAEDKAFKEGQRVGQYQAADKLYGYTTLIYLFKDDENPKMKEHIAGEAQGLVKDCEKFLNHNAKVYKAYVHSERYKRMHPVREQGEENG